MFLITINLDRYCGVAVVEDKDEVKGLIASKGYAADAISITWGDDLQSNWKGQEVYYGSVIIASDDTSGYYNEPYHLEAFPLPIEGDSKIIGISD